MQSAVLTLTKNSGKPFSAGELNQNLKILGTVMNNKLPKSKLN